MKKAFIQLHLAVFLAGFTAILGKLIQLNEVLLVAYRMALTFIILGAFLYITKQLPRYKKREIIRMALVGFVITTHWVCFYASIKYANVSEDNKKEMRSFVDGMRLNDERFLEFIKEFDSPWSVTMQTIWPNLIVQREMNTLGVRQIIPNGPNSMIMQWTMFGYEDDTEEMTRHRLRQGNLMGPAGFLGLEDNEAMKFAQEGIRRSSTDVNIIKLDKDKFGTSETLISEAAIRSMYQYYRQVMEL